MTLTPVRHQLNTLVLDQRLAHNLPRTARPGPARGRSSSKLERKATP